MSIEGWTSEESSFDYHSQNNNNNNTKNIMIYNDDDDDLDDDVDIECCTNDSRMNWTSTVLDWECPTTTTTTTYNNNNNNSNNDNTNNSKRMIINKSVEQLMIDVATINNRTSQRSSFVSLSSTSSSMNGVLFKIHQPTFDPTPTTIQPSSSTYYDNNNTNNSDEIEVEVCTSSCKTVPPFFSKSSSSSDTTLLLTTSQQLEQIRAKKYPKKNNNKTNKLLLFLSKSKSPSPPPPMTTTKSKSKIVGKEMKQQQQKLVVVKDVGVKKKSLLPSSTSTTHRAVLVQPQSAIEVSTNPEPPPLTTTTTAAAATTCCICTIKYLHLWYSCSQCIFTVTTCICRKPLIKILNIIISTGIKKPILTMLFIIGLSLLLFALGLLSNNYVYINNDYNTLWTPKTNHHSTTNTIMHEINNNFPPEPTLLQLFFHSGGKNILSKKHVRMIFNATDTLFNLPSYQSMCNYSNNFDNLDLIEGNELEIVTIPQHGITDIVTSSSSSAAAAASAPSPAPAPVSNTASAEHYHCSVVSGVIQLWNSSSLVYDWTVINDEHLIETMSSSSSFWMPTNTNVVVNDEEIYGSNRNQIYGNPIRHKTTGLLTSITGYYVTIQLPPMVKDQHHHYTQQQQQQLQQQQEMELRNLTQAIIQLNDIWKNDPEIPANFRVEVINTATSYIDEYNRAIEQDTRLFPLITAIIMILSTCMYLCWCCSRKQHNNTINDKMQTQTPSLFRRTVLTINGVIGSIFFGLLGSFGLMFLVGIPLTTITVQVVPVVIFSIALPNAFLIIDTYEKYVLQQIVKSTAVVTVLKNKKTKGLGMKQDDKKEGTITDTVVQECGFSIALTTIATTSTFGIVGWLSSIPAISWICLYSLSTIAIVFFCQITYLMASIVLIDENRSVPCNGRNDKHSLPLLLCCCIQRREYQEMDENNTNQNSHLSNPTSSNMMRSYADKLLLPKMQVIVVLSFLILGWMCAWSASEFDPQYVLEDIMPSSSYFTSYIQAVEMYGGERSTASLSSFSISSSPLSPPRIGVYFRNEDFSGEKIQQQMESFINDLTEMKSVNLNQPEHFWLRDFRNFAKSGFPSDDISSLSFNDQLKEFLNDHVFYDLYHRDMVFASDGRLIESRCFINVDIPLDQVQTQIKVYREQDVVTRAQPSNQGKYDLSFFTYDKVYSQWSFYSSSSEQIMTTAVVGILLMTIVAFLYIGYWIATLLIGITACSIYIDVLGILHWAGIYINPMISVLVVMSTGLIIAYSMHILLRFYEISGMDNRERHVETICTAGRSVFAGGICSLLGTVPLVFCTSEAFFDAFVSFVIFITVPVAHGLLFLPVALSAFGGSNARTTSDMKQQQINSHSADVLEKESNVQEFISCKMSI